MKPQKALAILDQLVAQMKLNREENALVMDALLTLNRLVEQDANPSELSVVDSDVAKTG